jgi:uncharacterized Zn finger protein
MRERIKGEHPDYDKLKPEERAVLDHNAILKYLESGQQWKSINDKYTSKVITSKGHEIYVKQVTKTISDTDDKRYYLPDGIHSLA